MPSASSRSAVRQHEQLGALLTRLRTERDVPQKRVAQRAGIDGSTLSRLESGERGVSREVLNRICDALGIGRRDRLDVLVAADFLTPEAAKILADQDLRRLGNLLTSQALSPEHAVHLRQYVNLALAHARALGYELDPE